MTYNKRNEFWLFNSNNFSHNNNGHLVDRVSLISGRRVPTKKSSLASNVTLILFMLLTIFFCYLISTGSVNYPNGSTSTSDKSSPSKPLSPPPPPVQPSTILNQKQYPLECPTKNPNKTCLDYNYPTNHTSTEPDPSKTCPDYFRWIHEDLALWKTRGITREMVEEARKTAHFRLIILNGKVYVERFKKSLQTRDEFTIWGFIQLLRWYPGKLPDLELMFDCNDRPVINAKLFSRPNLNPPALFRYCSDDFGLDIVFPDWSFWGWAETNIKAWRDATRDVKEGNKRIKWEDRVPYAYWRGNPNVHRKRQDLLRCNATNDIDWNARLYVQDWKKQAKVGYKESNLDDQCTHRYKIYIEGWAWSVSQKYILACDSMTLLVQPTYHEFYSRGMVPLVHYWPIRDNQKCKSLKFAVEWGNNHTEKAKAIGEAGSRYIHEDLKMENVYDYMFHLLNEYAKLLRFKPEIPPNAVELCPEAMACKAGGIWRKLMEDSLEKSPKDGVPCALPPPFEASSLASFIDRKNNLTRQVEMWEDNYWTSSPKHV